MGIRNLSTASISTGVKRSKFWDQSAVYVPPIFESIVTLTPGGTNTAEFSAIPQTYNHLQIRGTYRCTNVAGTIRLRFGNGGIDTGSNYTHHEMSGSGSGSGTAWTSVGGDSAYLFLESQRNYWWSFVIDIINYKDTNKWKVSQTRIGGDNNGVGYVGYASDMWMSNDPITNIRFYTQSGNFDGGSQFALYGIGG